MTDEQRNTLLQATNTLEVEWYLRDCIKVALEEIDHLRLRLLSAAGDDLCRLTPEEIKAYTSGKVQIPPETEFLASCRRFHMQIAQEAGELKECLTLAQLIAENARLNTKLTKAREYIETLQGGSVQPD